MEGDELDLMLPPDCQNKYFDTWDRHNSIAFTTATKGLHNAPGENNCFVNSAVQVFWHLDVFRRSYRRLSGHTCMGNSCIFCALKVIFTQFQFSDQSSLHPDALRKALAETFVNQQRFQLGHMDDAAECFENILRRIHFHIAGNCHEDSCTAPHCLPHQKFSLHIVEKVVCPCGASSNPLKFTEMVHYISAKALVSQARVMQETGDMLHPDRFGLLLRKANAMGDIRDCPGGCGRHVQIQRTLLNSPDVVSIGLVWDSDHPSVETTTEVARNIGTNILMQDVFHSVMQDLRSLPKMQLVGLVCYYGKHYSTFVFHSKLQVWIYFDDATVREIGKCWDDVVDKCSKGRYQPLLLLYANPNASPIAVDTAPKKRTMAPGYGLQGGPDEDIGLDRTQESISNQHSYLRSRTPNPEPQFQPKRQNLLPRARSVTPSPGEIDNNGSSTMTYDHSRQQSFIMAVSSKPDKVKHQLKFGGQSSASVGMMPSSNQPDDAVYLNIHSSQSSCHEDDNYSDYTLSTSGQYKRPSLEGFEPNRIPLTPNIKGHDRKDSFKKDKESIRADIVRYQVGSSKQQDNVISNNIPYQGNDITVQSHMLSSKNGKVSLFYQTRDQPNFRQRSMSQEDGNEVFGKDNLGNENHTQHVILKPMANTQNYDQLDDVSYSHTPVQSGLATLPRKKKESSKDLLSHQRQYNQDGINAPNGNLSLIQENKITSIVSGRPSHVPEKYPPSAIIENTNNSICGRKTPDLDKKAKKLFKKEQKKAEKKKLKSDLSKSQPDLSGLVKPLTPSSNSIINMQRSIEVSDDKITYIDRKMVESILKHQGLQRNPSTHSTNSSSSVESDTIMGKLIAAKHGENVVPTDVSFDNVSLGSHKDSGYGSSDRNSSSSTGSGTIDPYIQYFISKSMVVPRNLNPNFLQHSTHQMTSDLSNTKNQMYNPNINTDSQKKDLSTMSREEINRHLYETLTQRKVMHPIKESSQEDILKILPKEHTSVSTPPRGSTPTPASDVLNKDGREPPIPPKNFAAFQVSKSIHQREPSIDSLDINEVENDYFVSMCEKADDLMDSCIIAETKGDLNSALRYCDSALGCLKEAMNQIDISNKALVYAQKKHNACLLKSRSLFKRTASQASGDGKRSSITSSDSDNSDRPIRRAVSKEHLLVAGRGATTHGQVPNVQQGSAGKPVPVPTQQQLINAKSQVREAQPAGSLSSSSYTPSNQQNSFSNSNSQLNMMSDQQQMPHQPKQYHVSRSSAADKSDSESTHSRSGSNSSSRSSSSVPSQVLPQSVAKSQIASESTFISKRTSNSPAPLDSYGTMPRNRQNRRTSDPTGKSEVYKTYLNRQKNVTIASGIDSINNDINVQKKINQSEIGGSVDNSNAQRHLQQLTSQSQKHNNLGEAAEGKHYQGQRISCESAGQAEKNNNLSEIQTASTYFGRPGSNNGSTAATAASTQQHVSNSQSSVSSVKSVPHSFSSPQLTLGSVQHLQQSQQWQQQSQSVIGSNQPILYQQQHLPDHPSKFIVQFQNSLPVSGYSQPLPGQRPSAFLQQSSGTNIHLNVQENRSQHYLQAYSQSNLSTNAALQSQNLINDTPSHLNSQTNSSQGIIPLTSQASSVSPYRSNQQNNIQNITQNVQNINIRKNSGGAPPPPPARTTSNPDFKQQLPQQSSQPQQQQYQNEYHQWQPEQSTNSEVGYSSQQRNVVRVYPNNYVDPRRPVAADVSSHMNSQGMQIKHATSTTALNYISVSSRPLERYASQPDCQNLVDSASNSSKDLLPSSFAQGHMLSSKANARPVIHLGDAASKNLPQISDNLQPQRQNGQHNSHLTISGDDSQNETKPSVRALASRFDTTQEKPAIKPKPSVFSLLKSRNKSESGSKKPKSVLKSKKNKSCKTPRKSVTFAEDISNYAAGYESAAELTSFSGSGTVTDRAYYSDDDDNFISKNAVFSDNDIDDEVENSSNSDDIQMVREELACHLCHKREIEMGKAYCSKCCFYMSRLVQS